MAEIGNKVESFLTQQQQYLEMQHPHLTAAESQNPLNLHFDKVTYNISSTGPNGKPRILISVAKSAIKDARFLSWIKVKDQSIELL